MLSDAYVDDDAPYEVVLTPPARRALAEGLPEAVPTAVIDLLTVTLVSQPRRVGQPRLGWIADIHSARRGTFRVFYRIREDQREVVVHRIEHRGDIHRRRWMQLSAVRTNAPRPAVRAAVATVWRRALRVRSGNGEGEAERPKLDDVWPLRTDVYDPSGDTLSAALLREGPGRGVAAPVPQGARVVLA